MSFFPVRLLEEWSRSPESLRLASALLHFVWQGAVLAALAALVLLAMRRSRPQVRYAALLVLLGAMAVCPVVTFIWPGTAEMAINRVQHGGRTSDVEMPTDRSESRLEAWVTASSSLTDSTDAGQIHGRMQEGLRASDAPIAGVPESTSGASSAARSSTINWGNLVRSLQAWLERHRHWFVAAWGMGVVLLSLRLAVGLFGAERTRRCGVAPAAEAVQQALARLMARMEIPGPVRIMESALAEVPTLVGWLRPVILLPVGALCGLTPVQLESLLAHELAHIRRHDYLVNLWQAVIETILFYHPAVWWLSRKIREEREHCCDDMAVALCGDRVAYARALATLEERRSPVPRWAVAAGAGSLAARIRRIVGRLEPVSDRRPAAAALIVAVLLLAVGGAMNLRQIISADESAKANATTIETGPSSDLSAAAAPASEEQPAAAVVSTVATNPTRIENEPQPVDVSMSNEHAGKEAPRAVLDQPPSFEVAQDSKAGKRSEAKREEEASASEKTNLKRTWPDAEGRFTLTFENPLAKGAGKRMMLDPEKNQVIFQVFVKNAEGRLLEKIFKQIPAQKDGGYRVNVQVNPELIEHTQLAITFLTIQPDHDQWVKRFFHDGKGTSYKGMWSSDGGKLPAVIVDEATLGWIDGNASDIADGGGNSQNPDAKPDPVSPSADGPRVKDPADARRVTDRSEAAVKKLIAEMTSLKRNRQDAEGRFTVSFDNPLPPGSTERVAVDPSKNEVILQVFVRDAQGKLQEKVVNQVPAQKSGPYRVNIQLKPELLKRSQMTLFFVTLQPDHEEWVKRVIHSGDGKADKAIWSSQGCALSALAVDATTAGWLSESKENKQSKPDEKPADSDTKVDASPVAGQEKAVATDAPTAAQILKMVVERNRFWLDPQPENLSYKVIGGKPGPDGMKEMINRVQISGDKVRWEMDVADSETPEKSKRAAEPLNYSYIFMPGKTVCLRAPAKVNKTALENKRETPAFRQGMLIQTGLHMLAAHGIPERCRIVDESPTKEGRDVIVECELKSGRGNLGLGMEHVYFGRMGWRIDKFRLHVRLPDGVPIKEEYFDPMTGALTDTTVSFGPEYLKVGDHLAPFSVRLVQKRDPAARRGVGFREWILEGRFQNVEGNWLLDKATNTQDGTVVRQLQVTDISTAPVPAAAFEPPPRPDEENKAKAE